MISKADKFKAQQMLLDINHFIICNNNPEKGFERITFHQPTPAMKEYLLSSNPWLHFIFEHYENYRQTENKMGKVIEQNLKWD